MDNVILKEISKQASAMGLAFTGLIASGLKSEIDASQEKIKGIANPNSNHNLKLRSPYSYQFEGGKSDMSSHRNKLINKF